MAHVENEAAALAALKISVRIQEARRGDLKRVAELINRTNQFNLCGSRTSAQELEREMGKGHSIITAEVSDKFGRMGIVGVMRVDYKPGRVEIPIFVLSCRAFGFGIEYALLNSIKKLASGEDAIVGHYRETQSNAPCRQLYPVSGLSSNGESWTGRIEQLRSDPSWLAIENRITPRALVQLADQAAQGDEPINRPQRVDI